MLTGKPVITVIFSGRPLLLSETAERSEALIQAWFPGTEGGRAVADLITGKTEPQGRLTMSFPRNMGQIPLYYNAFSTGRPVTGENPDYMKDLAQSFINMATTVPVILFMSIFCAVLLNQNFRGRGIARVIFFIPIVYASSAMLNVDTGNVMQQAMQNSSYAVESSKGMAGFQMAELISQIGLPDDFIEIITGIVDKIYNVVQLSGVQIIIMLAALQSISPSLYEAAYAEGAGGFEKFWLITLPMSASSIVLCLIYSIINSFVAYDNPVVKLTKQMMTDMKYGYSAAMSWTYFVIVFVILAAVYAVGNRAAFTYDKQR